MAVVSGGVAAYIEVTDFDERGRYDIGRFAVPGNEPERDTAALAVVSGRVAAYIEVTDFDEQGVTDFDERGVTDFDERGEVTDFDEQGAILAGSWNALRTLNP